MPNRYRPDQSDLPGHPWSTPHYTDATGKTGSTPVKPKRRSKPVVADSSQSDFPHRLMPERQAISRAIALHRGDYPSPFTSVSIQSDNPHPTAYVPIQSDVLTPVRPRRSDRPAPIRRYRSKATSYLNPSPSVSIQSDEPLRHNEDHTEAICQTNPITGRTEATFRTWPYQVVATIQPISRRTETTVLPAAGSWRTRATGQSASNRSDFPHRLVALLIKTTNRSTLYLFKATCRVRSVRSEATSQALSVPAGMTSRLSRNRFKSSRLFQYWSLQNDKPVPSDYARHAINQFQSDEPSRFWPAPIKATVRAALYLVHTKATIHRISARRQSDDPNLLQPVQSDLPSRVRSGPFDSC